MEYSTKIYFQKEIEKLNNEDYKLFLKENNGNYFQTLDFFNIHKNLKNQIPFLIINYSNQKIISTALGVITFNNGFLGLKKILTKRIIIIGGPLFTNDISLNLILEELVKFGKSKNAIYIEIRNLHSQENVTEYFINNEFEYVPYLNYLINIPDMKSGKIGLSKSREREKNKGIRSGATISEITSKEELNELYSILLNLYQTKIKKPLVEKTLFENLYENKNSSKIFVVKKENTVIGGCVGVIYDKIFYDWYRCGLDREYKNYYPSVLASWAGIEYSMNNNYEIFDFMGAGKPDEDYGVRNFKAKFGGELVEYGRYRYINHKIFFKLGEAALKIMQR